MARLTYRIPNTNMQMQMSNDPWFNLGQIAANIWGQNYNKRGIEKGYGDAERAYKEYLANNGGQVPNSLYTQGQQAGVISPNGITADSISQANMGNVSNSITPNIATSNTAQQPTQGVDLKNTFFGDYSTDNFLKKNGYVNPQTISAMPQRDLKAEKLDYINQKYNSGTLNPDGDSIVVNGTVNNVNGNLNGLDAQGMQKMFANMPQIDKAGMEAAIRRELIKNGRTDYQISKIMENISPTLDSKLNQYNQMQVGQLRELLDNQIKAGEIDNANVTYAKITKLDPSIAKGLEYKMKRAIGRYDNDYNIQQKINQYMAGRANRQEAENLAYFGNIGGIQGMRDAYAAKRLGLLGGNGGPSRGRSPGSNDAVSQKPLSIGGYGGLSKDEWDIIKKLQEQAKLIQESDPEGYMDNPLYKQLMTGANRLIAKAAEHYGSEFTPEKYVRDLKTGISLGASQEDVMNSLQEAFGKYELGDWEKIKAQLGIKGNLPFEGSSDGYYRGDMSDYQTVDEAKEEAKVIADDKKKTSGMFADQNGKQRPNSLATLTGDDVSDWFEKHIVPGKNMYDW